jgi:cyclic pyranopterin monophosphate synthase
VYHPARAIPTYLLPAARRGIITKMAQPLSHFDEHGASRMVDVSQKPITQRTARASATVRMSPATLAMVRNRELAKGDVFEVARLAGIMAAKRTADLIPLCHPLPLDSVSVDFSFSSDSSAETAAVIRIDATVSCTAKTGVEMEALTVASVAALTIYDMCKSVDRGITIERIQLDEKAGGRSGTWQRNSSDKA